MIQRPMLYVSDPKAIHSILVKDEPFYQESPAFTEVARVSFGPGLLSTLADSASR
ncbi:uncharacterized protein C8Q71DRAFT_782391 [Rhodofomes roseus]|uniref:Cytochrome P450 n=1 Tax=Rhodofomes roseus TaxID=34475 RepID=A0ABQ8K4I8_9APHY|nr:uncharacterized protein C8Q71DRAFT_782391 [Rhodofomes roseus]KAH9831404.1 hypothetical protein C8Q71DRAFT_782391 [Rhodofomes roseus]